VTLAVVLFERVPQGLALQPVRLQRTPAPKGPPVTVAVKLAEPPGSRVRLDGPETATAVGLVVLAPPQPARVAAMGRNRRETREIAAWALRWMRVARGEKCSRGGLLNGGPSAVGETD
jgi:hypothetical protein